MATAAKPDDGAEVVRCPACDGSGADPPHASGMGVRRCGVCGGYGELTKARRDAWWAEERDRRRKGEG